ncbi:MAG: DUF2019 domain-containing protein [Bacteroidia bacterium]
MINNIKDFEDLALKHGDAIQAGDYKAANKLHSKLTKIYDQLKATNNVKELLPLTKGSDKSVKLWSATFLLKEENQIALDVLNEIAKSESILSMSASSIIDMWNKKMLIL